MSEESIENITKPDSNFARTFVDYHLLPDMNFNGNCFIKNNISIPKKVINPYIYYTLGPQLKNLNTDLTLGNCLFGSAKLTKNADLNKYKYSGYGFSFRIFITWRYHGEKCNYFWSWYELICACW